MRRCGCSPRCCRTWSGCWAATTPTRSRPATTSRAWTGEVGDAREALRLFAELLPDQERVLGRDHPDTLMTRNNIAHWTGEVGDAREALRLFTRAAAGPGAGAGPRPPRHAHDPQQHRLLDRRGGGRAGGVAAVHARCCRTWSGCWAATTPTRSRPATTSRSGPARWGTRVRRCGCSRAAAGPGAGAGPRPPRHAHDTRGHQAAGISRIPIPGREGRVERSGSLIRRLMSWWKRPR